MNKNFVKKLIFGLSILILFIIVGLVYALLPMEAKINANLDFGLSYGWHIFISVMIVIIGIVFFILALTTGLMKAVNKYGAKYWYVFLIFDISKWIVIVLGGAFLLAGGVGVANTVT